MGDSEIGSWQQLTLRLSARALPQAEALLRLAGAASIAIADGGDSPILEPEPETLPLWPRLRVSALFDAAVDAGALANLLDSLGPGDITVERIDSPNKVESEQEPIEPLEIGPRLAIVPADALTAGDPHAVGLHMGLAFGTGRHPTTRLCLEWLEREIRPGMTVLDYGTGNGILALAALRLGATHATAIDNEPQALVATQRNADLNGLGPSIRIGPPGILGRDAYDLIISNILVQPLIELAETFAAHQRRGGRIVLSGVLSTQLGVLEARYRNDYEALAHRTRAGWGLLTGKRRNGYDR